MLASCTHNLHGCKANTFRSVNECLHANKTLEFHSPQLKIEQVVDNYAPSFTVTFRRFTNHVQCQKKYFVQGLLTVFFDEKTHSKLYYVSDHSIKNAPKGRQSINTQWTIQWILGRQLEQVCQKSYQSRDHPLQSTNQNILQPNSCCDGGNYSCRLKTYIILLHAVKVTSESQVATRGTAVWLGLAFQS